MVPQLRFLHFEVLTRPDGSPHLLGKGAMGLTYKAFDRNLLSLAVVKVIAPEQLGRPEARQRFLQEAQSMARIKHPHVADVFYLGDCPQGVFYAMEFCDGPSVQEFIEEQGPLPPADVLRLGYQAAQALEAVEQHHLIHRDIKPSNMILVNDPQGRSRIKLIDFGLARDVLRDPNLSQGGFVGTPTFASPEQLLEQSDLDIRSDIYSLGITLWAMLASRPPFGGSQFEVMFHHVNTPPPWERLPAMPEAARQLLGRMIEKSADERFQSSREMVLAFQTVLESEGYGCAEFARLSLGVRETAGSVLGLSSFEILSEVADSDLIGKLFRARDAHDGQIIALKYLHPGLVSKPVVLGKIQRHVLSLRPLHHPNLIGVLGFEKSGDEAKIISEWVMGPSLLALLKARNSLNLAEAASLLAQLASGLDFAASKGLATVETDLHQILLTSPAWGEEPAAWAGWLRKPLASWEKVTLKINPLRLSLAEQDYPSLVSSAGQDPTGGGPKPMLGAFLQLVYRLLGGAGGSQSSSRGGGFVSIPSLGAEANDLIESFALPPFSKEKRETTCATVLKELCRAEGVLEPVIFELPPELEEDLLLTRDATEQGAALSESYGRYSSPLGSSVTSLPVMDSRGGGNLAQASSRGMPPRPSTVAGSQVPLTSRSGSMGGSHAGRISADYDLKRKELELQRQRLETDAERLKQEEVIEATRAMLDEERSALAMAREEFARQERERAQRAEQERLKLQEERARLEAKTSEIEAKRREQERLEQEIQLRAQFEFQKIEEQRRQREAEWLRQREAIERSLQEREELSLVREQQSFRKLKEERERLRAHQAALEEGKGDLRQEVENELRQQVGQLESERQRLADQQSELDRKLLAQGQELTALREKFELAEGEIEARYQRLAQQETAAAARRQSELESERSRLFAERELLEQQRAEFAVERAVGTATHAVSDQQQEENAAALARLVGEEARLTASRLAFAEERALRESALAEELSEARQDLSNERAELAREAERARETSIAELAAERLSISSIRSQLAAEECLLAAQVKEKTGALDAELSRQQAELDAERQALAEQRDQLDAEHRRLTADFTNEKEAFAAELEARRCQEEASHRQLMQQRAQELGLIEQKEQGRLAALRQEIAQEEIRIQHQRQDVFSQEQLISRMDQEANYQDDEVREKLEAEQTRLEAQRVEIGEKLLELQKAHKKRLLIIAAGIFIAVAAASGAGYVIKGRLMDPAKLRGQEAWVQFERERGSTLAEADWPKLLNWCVVTDLRFRTQETDLSIRHFYEEKRSLVLADSYTALKGILINIEGGWKPPPPESEAFKKLRQNLEVVARLEGVPPERLLVLAKLDMPYLTARHNSGAALKIYTETITAVPDFIPQLKGELGVTIQGMLADFLEDHVLDNQEALTAQLQQLPGPAKESVLPVRLLLSLLEAEAARSSPPEVETLALALSSVNEPATSPEMSAAYRADPTWATILRQEVDRILTTIQNQPHLILSLKDVLAATAEQWKIDQPYLMLAGAAELTQQKLDFYQAAEKLTGNPEARARVAGFYIQQAVTLIKSGRTDEARQLLEQAMPRIQETAAKGEPEAMALLSDVLRQGLTGTKQLDEAIDWALKARAKGHPDADFSLGLCYLEKEEETRNPQLIQQSVAAFVSATQQATSPNAPRAWYFLANAYSRMKDFPALVAALEQGAQRQDPDSLYMLGQCLMAGLPYYKTANLTLGRDHITKAARHGHFRAIEFLKTNARIWEKSGLPADREWLKQNEDLLRKKTT